jgi:hypothetical protein
MIPDPYRNFFIEDSKKHQKKIYDVNTCGEQRSKDVNVSWFLRFLTWLPVARTGERINVRMFGAPFPAILR